MNQFAVSALPLLPGGTHAGGRSMNRDGLLTTRFLVSWQAINEFNHWGGFSHEVLPACPCLLSIRIVIPLRVGLWIWVAGPGENNRRPWPS